MSDDIRQPAVAGAFYPADALELRRQVEGFLAAVEQDGEAAAPIAIIAPHAGYVYSGPVAASAYATVDASRVRRVVLFGPAHRVAFSGVGASSARCWRTPLGDVPVAAPTGIPAVDIAHQQEHSLEVQLPFMQVVLEQFTLIPLVVGDIHPASLAPAMEQLWGDDDTLVVVSADLSHFESYARARAIDNNTSEAIINLDDNSISHHDSCGCVPIRALLQVARKKGLRPRLLDLRNSGDTAGDRRRVVGYGAYAFYYDQ